MFNTVKIELESLISQINKDIEKINDKSFTENDLFQLEVRFQNLIENIDAPKEVYKYIEELPRNTT